jgi:co-chaperonin GroES (HSP10)
MSATGLVLPRHIHEERQAQLLRKQREAAVERQGALVGTHMHRMDSDDFVSVADVAKQLEMLQAYADARREADGHAAYQLPKPLGWKVALLALTIPEETQGGVLMLDDAREARSLSTPQGVVLQLGNAAYRDPDRFKYEDDLEPWVNVGDRISFVKYDAAFFQLANGQRIAFITDTQPLSLIDGPWEVPK